MTSFFFYTETTTLWQFIVNVLKSLRQPQSTLHLVSFGLHVPFRWQQHPKWAPAILVVYPTFLCKFLLSCPTTHTRNLTSYVWRFRFISLTIQNLPLLCKFLLSCPTTHSKNVTSYVWRFRFISLAIQNLTFFPLTKTDIITSQNFYISFWITLYISA